MVEQILKAFSEGEFKHIGIVTDLPAKVFKQLDAEVDLIAISHSNAKFRDINRTLEIQYKGYISFTTSKSKNMLYIFYETMPKGLSNLTEVYEYFLGVPGDK